MVLPSLLTVIARVHPVHAMNALNAKQRQVAADRPWDQASDLSNRQLETTSTIAIYNKNPSCC